MSARYGCPVELALDLLGGKWRVVILARLKQQGHRYADLRRALPQLSEKMLSQRLRELRDSGLITQRDGVYALSARGESAREVLQALYCWGSELAIEIGAEVGADAAPLHADVTSQRNTRR